MHMLNTDGYIDFEWDGRKASSNIVKHGVSFEAAADAFSDPYARVVPDPKHSGHEERFFLIGMDLESRVLTVCHCERCGGAYPHHLGEKIDEDRGTTVLEVSK